MGMEKLGSRAIIGRYFKTLQEVSVASWALLISMLVPSDQESETYEATGMVPPMRERKGGRLVKGVREFSWTITNVDYETSVEIPLAWIRRDKTGQINRRIGELAIRNVQHWTKLVSGLVAAGAATTIYDGSYFFAATGAPHSLGSSGSQINDIAATEVAALGVTTPASPTAAEMSKAILGTVAYMMGYKDDQGEPINGDATQWMVLCPKGDIHAAALEALAPMLLNQAGEVLKNKFKVQVEVDPRSALTTQFYVFRTGDQVPPIIRQQETEGELKKKAEGSDYEFDNDAWQFGIDASRSVGFGEWQGAARCTLS